MPTIRLHSTIFATPERCFDLSRSVDLHMGSMTHTGERAVEGVTSGLMGPGDTVTWEARHLGLRWRLTSRIIEAEYARPHHFVDEQVRGPFRGFRHIHTFSRRDDGASTLMTDEFAYTAPLGPLGKLVDWMVLERYMRQLLRERNTYLKTIAEQVDERPEATGLSACP